MNEITTRKRLIELLKFWNILEVEVMHYGIVNDMMFGSFTSSNLKVIGEELHFVKKDVERFICNVVDIGSLTSRGIEWKVNITQEQIEQEIKEEQEKKEQK